MIKINNQGICKGGRSIGKFQEQTKKKSRKHGENIARICTKTKITTDTESVTMRRQRSPKF